MIKIKKIRKILGLIILALLMIGVIGYSVANYITDKGLKKELQKIRDAGEEDEAKTLFNFCCNTDYIRNYWHGRISVQFQECPDS